MLSRDKNTDKKTTVPIKTTITQNEQPSVNLKTFTINTLRTTQSNR